MTVLSYRAPKKQGGLPSQDHQGPSRSIDHCQDRWWDKKIVDMSQLFFWNFSTTMKIDQESLLMRQLTHLEQTFRTGVGGQAVK